MYSLLGFFISFLGGVLFGIIITILIFSIKNLRKSKRENKTLDSDKNLKDNRFASQDIQEIIIIEFNEQSLCSICLENLRKYDVIKLLKCGHYYHKECIDEWFEKHNECPQCRKPNI